MRGRYVRVAFGVVLAGIGTLLAQKAIFRPIAVDTATPKIVLVELFTSEGCSSCPPADALLRQLDATLVEGQLVLGISEHVTYWNSLGWRDPYSAEPYTDRQNAYGSRFGLDGVYTPQMVVNGADQLVGSDKTGVLRAIQREASQPSRVAVKIVSASVADGVVKLKFSAVGEPSVKSADVLAVMVDDADQTSVPRGENSGRTLTHVAVARALVKVGGLREGEQAAEVPLPAGFRAGQAHHLIVFAQMPGYGRVLGVARAAL